MSKSKSLKESEMESAINAFKDWRITREKMCRIPDRLWKIAAKLSPKYPISTICENLGLNWGALKKRIDHLSLSANANHPIKPHKQLPFVELKLNSQEKLSSLLLNHSTSPRCAIELTKSDGTVMKIFASNDGDSPLNLLELFKTFLGNSK